MKDLIKPENTKKFLKKHDVNAKKRFGQNFLADEAVLDSIITGSGITKDDTVLEIGPGIGTLTQALCLHAGKVIAVEIDSSMLPYLAENLEGFTNYELINADILDLDIAKLLGNVEGRIKIAANLPYYITTPIIMKLLSSKIPAESITVMVQKEVAERMQASPGGKDYGALSLAVQYYSFAEVLAIVPPQSFIPSPRVSSAVIKLTLSREPRALVNDEAHMFSLIKAAFSKRRKKLSNAIAGMPGAPYTRTEAEAALSSMRLPPDIRGECLSLSEFATLSNNLQAAGDSHSL